MNLHLMEHVLLNARRIILDKKAQVNVLQKTKAWRGIMLMKPLIYLLINQHAMRKTGIHIPHKKQEDVLKTAIYQINQ